MTRTSMIMFALSSLVGCVSQGKYDDMKQLHDSARADLAERTMQVGTLDEELKQERARSQTLQQRLEEIQTRLAAIEQQRTDLVADIGRLEQQGAQQNGQLAALIKDRSQLKQSTEQMQAALNDLAARKLEADRRVAEYKDLLTRFKHLIDAGTLKVAIRDGRMVLQLPTDVLFDSGSAKLSDTGKEAVSEVASVLKDIQERRFQVEGHTDSVPIHTAQYRSNWDLAAARALGVVRAMTAAGIQGTLLSAASYGEFHPVASNDAAEGRAENRRIEIVVMPDLSMLPGYEELQRAVAPNPS